MSRAQHRRVDEISKLASKMVGHGEERRLLELLTQIPKLGNRRRARRLIGLLRREKSRSPWQLFGSVGVTARCSLPAITPNQFGAWGCSCGFSKSPQRSLYGCTTCTGRSFAIKGRPSFAHWKIEPCRLKTLARLDSVNFAAALEERTPTEQ